VSDDEGDSLGRLCQGCQTEQGCCDRKGDGHGPGVQLVHVLPTRCFLLLFPFPSDTRSHVTVCKRHPDSLYVGDGPAYWRMWDLLVVTGKEEARVVMTVNGQVERLSENRVVMTERSTVMGVSAHTYRLGSYADL
jgi:hypothetical protein